LPRVLAVSDLHIPFEHKDAFKFIKHNYNEYDCNEIVFMGDMFDVYSISRYTKSPDSLNVSDEFKRAKDSVKTWVKEFPKAKCLIGNHEARINKRLTENGIPREFIKSFNELFGLPKEWIWGHEFIINDVHYLHGNRDGIYSHVNIARDMRRSVVTGHTHTSGGIHYLSNYADCIFALNVGCLIDQTTYAFNYSAEQSRKAVLGSGIVINNIPHFIPL
jgi:predicted phosphodiesterase